MDKKQLQTPQAVQACHELLLWMIPHLDKFKAGWGMPAMLTPTACGKVFFLLLSFSGGLAKVARVLRGGSWNNNTRNLRSANRNNNSPGNRNNNNGFRLSSLPAIPGMALFKDKISAASGYP